MSPYHENYQKHEEKYTEKRHSLSQAQITVGRPCSSEPLPSSAAEMSRQMNPPRRTLHLLRRGHVQSFTESPILGGLRVGRYGCCHLGGALVCEIRNDGSILLGGFHSLLSSKVIGRFVGSQTVGEQGSHLSDSKLSSHPGFGS